MANRKNIYVVRAGNDWAVRREGSDRRIGVHGTQSEALEQARPIAQRGKGELFIQGQDGKFRDRDSYGNDPFPPRDSKH